MHVIYEFNFHTLYVFQWWVSATYHMDYGINTLRLKQNGHHFADDFFKYIFLNGNVLILIKNSLKFVPKGPINNIPSLVQIMAWYRPGNKPLSEPWWLDYRLIYASLKLNELSIVFV